MQKQAKYIGGRIADTSRDLAPVGPYQVFEMPKVQIVPYRFSVTEKGDITFSVHGRRVKEATLEINTCKLSVIVPKYPEGSDAEIESLEVPLRFFDDTPLHMNLAGAWKAFVTLHVEEPIKGRDIKKFPSLTMNVAASTLSWNTIMPGVPDVAKSFDEKVITYGDNGKPQQRILSYRRNLCGFLPRSSDVPPQIAEVALQQTVD